MTRTAHRILKADPVMAALIEAAVPFRLEPRADCAPFEALVRAIAHQQLHGAAAQCILARFTQLFADTIFPLPQQVLDAPDAQLRGVGFSYAKIAALKDLASKTLAGVVPAATELATLTDSQIIERLTAVRGIGRWTVEMLLLFQLQRPDVLPADDFGVRNGFRLAYGLDELPTPRALTEFGERWKPHRSMAAWYLWRAVELSRQDRLPGRVRVPRVPTRPPGKRARAPAKRTPPSARRAGPSAKRARPPAKRAAAMRKRRRQQ